MDIRNLFEPEEERFLLIVAKGTFLFFQAGQDKVHRPVGKFSPVA